ncbi:Imm1 family immunity protein [Crossiella sp. CA198]|uniref:Imm1 family immunity protein n=1 Tax=Crossiella sp. CA198 TaxID=3455607 RepID=UPI003F8D7B2E
MTPEHCVHATVVPDDEPFVITTAEDVDRLYDYVHQRIRERGGSPLFVELAYMTDVAEDEFPVAEFRLGLNPRNGRGVLSYSGIEPPGTWFSIDTQTTPPGVDITVTYQEWGGERDVPANSEIPEEDTKRAMVEFMTSGGALPTVIEWQATGAGQ